MEFDVNNLKQTREPKEYMISEKEIAITTDPGPSSFEAKFTHMEMTECQWK